MKSRFLLFKASAGSGKTYNLAIQYIALLVARGEHEFRYTLAVTFTNKATAEMKDRILEFLYAVWKGRPGSDGKVRDIQQAIEKLYGERPEEEQIRERCGSALHAILHDYSRFTVSTIDAFFQTVLRSMAHELGLSARLQADLDDKNVIELAVESLIDGLRHDNRDVLPWLRQYIEQQLEEGHSWDVRRKLKDIALMLFREEYLKRSLDPRNLPFDIQNIAAFRKTLEAERARLLAPLKQEAERFEELVRGTGMGYEELFSYQADVRRYIENIRSGNTDTAFGKRLSDMAAEPKKLMKAALRGQMSLVPAFELMAGQLARIGNLHAEAQKRLGSISLALSNLTPMGLLGAIEKEVTRLSAERNRFMLARTPIMLRRMIQDEDASFIFERTGTLYRNIMIDEFQDTSRLQWENFRTLLIDNLASGGLSMIVGDIKQSIYRWRNGDWRILYELGMHGHQGIPLIQEPLNDNYRSMGRIVTFNNNFFPPAAKALDNMVGEDCNQLQRLYEEVRQRITKDPDGGYVRIRLPRSAEKDFKEAWPEVMLEDMAGQVEQFIAQGMPLSEMTILVRHNKHIPTIIAYFAERMPHVRMVSGEAFLLGASVAVNMLVCALAVVDDPERDPVAMRYLMKHYRQDVLHAGSSVNEAMLAQPEDILPEAFIARLDELRHIPLYELCERLFRLLSIERMTDRQDAYLFAFFDELSGYLRDNPADISTFLLYWQEQMQRIPIPGNEVEGIRLFSIHKSKGLAFHTVLMPFAEWDMEKDRNNATNWCMTDEAPLNGIGSLPIRFTAGKIQGTAFEKDYIEEHANRRADELNALYVAFTRAKANLYVWGLSEHTLKEKRLNETVADLMRDVLETALDEEDIYISGTQPVIAARKEETEEKDRYTEVSMKSYDGCFTFRQSGEAETFIRPNDGEQPDEKVLGYIEQGKLLHYIFSKIETEGDIDRVTEDFLRQGILKSEKQKEAVRRLAHNGLRNEHVKDWFSGRYRLFNECNILVPDPEHSGHLQKRRPDRVMLSAENIIVVDFKFGRPDEEHGKQVGMYVSIMQEMYPDRNVEGWLWYVYKNKVEKV